MDSKLQALINEYMPRRYYGHEARKYAKVIAEEYAALKVQEAQAKCTIPVVSGSLPLASDEEIQKYVTERFSESHLLPEIIAFRAIKYYQQGMPPVSGRRCCLDESEGKQ
jgi:hypothetical protein